MLSARRSVHSAQLLKKQGRLQVENSAIRGHVLLSGSCECCDSLHVQLYSTLDCASKNFDTKIRSEPSTFHDTGATTRDLNV